MKSINRTTYRQLLHRLTDARKGAEFTQAELGKKLGHPQSYVSKIENGDRRLDLVEFVEWCQAITVDPHALVDEVVVSLAREKRKMLR